MISGDTISAQSVIGAFANKNAGTNKSYNISLSGNLTGIDSENYYINTSAIYTGANGVIQKLNITSVSNIAISNKIYDGTTNANINVSAVTFNGAISGDNLSISSGSGNFGDKNVGVNKLVTITNLTLGGADSGNYNLISNASSITGVANITQKSINVIANNQNKTYDGTSTVLNSSDYTLSGLVANESIAGATMVYDSKNAGDGTKTILISNATQGSNTNLSNYDISYVHSTGNTISKANITAISNIVFNDKVYDGNKNTSINSTNAIYTGKISGDNLTLIGGSSMFISKDVGTSISASVTNYVLGGTDAGNYNLSPAASTYTGSANITPKSLVLTATSQTKTYDGTTSVANSSGFIASGLVANESIGSVNLVYSDKNAGNNKTIIIGAATSGFNTLITNYDISYVNSTTSTITKLQLNTATGFTALDKIYDGNTMATINKSGANFVGVLNGDQVSIANATGNFNNESVGTNKLVTIRNFVASDTDAGNYDVSNVSSNAYANITPNSSISNIDSRSVEAYSSVVKFSVLNTTYVQNDNLSYATYEQFGYPTFQDFILRKKTGEVIKKTIEISQSGVNKNLR